MEELLKFYKDCLDGFKIEGEEFRFLDNTPIELPDEDDPSASSFLFDAASLSTDKKVTVEVFKASEQQKQKCIEYATAFYNMKENSFSIEYHGIGLMNGILFIVYDRLPKTQISQDQNDRINTLESAFNSGLTELEFIQIIEDYIKALQCIHAQRLCHKNITRKSLLISNEKRGILGPLSIYKGINQTIIQDYYDLGFSLIQVFTGSNNQQPDNSIPVIVNSLKGCPSHLKKLFLSLTGSSKLENGEIELIIKKIRENISINPSQEILKSSKQDIIEQNPQITQQKAQPSIPSEKIDEKKAITKVKKEFLSFFCQKDCYLNGQELLLIEERKNQKQPQNYLQLLNELSDRYPQDSTIFYSLGFLFRSDEKIIKADQYFEKSCKLNQYHAQNYFFQARCCKDIKQFTNAISYFKQCIKLNPNNYKVYNEIGMIYQYQSEFELAKLYYQKSNSITQNVNSNTNLSLIYQKQGNFKEQERCLRKLVELENNCPEHYENLGKNAFRQGKYQQAYELWIKGKEITILRFTNDENGKQSVQQFNKLINYLQDQIKKRNDSPNT